MIIRLAGTSDIPIIAALHIEGWKGAYGGIVDQAYLDSLTVEKRIEDWTQWTASGESTVFLAEVSGTPRRLQRPQGLSDRRAGRASTGQSTEKVALTLPAENRTAVSGSIDPLAYWRFRLRHRFGSFLGSFLAQRRRDAGEAKTRMHFVLSVLASLRAPLFP